jgi:hypothetical protein
MAVDINGDGLIALGGTSTTQGRVRLAEDTDNGTNYVELTANAAVTTNRTVTFPDADINFTTGLSATLGGTGVTSAGTTGNVLTSNGTAWVSQAAAAGGGDYIMQVYAGPSTGTWTKPAGLKAIKVTVVGGGGSSGPTIPGPGVASGIQSGGGAGGAAIEYLDAPAIPGPQPYTAGGAAGTSSFGSPAFLSATGGSAGSNAPSTSLDGTPGGAGGAGSGGQLNITGGGGGGCFIYTICGPGVFLGGVGGSSMFGAGGLSGGGGQNDFNNGTAGSNYGGGGGGGGKTNNLGTPTEITQKAGGVGVVIIEEFY